MHWRLFEVPHLVEVAGWAVSESGRGRDFLLGVGVVVAVALLLGYLFAAYGVMRTANDPPLLADPAPDSAPVLICLVSTDSARRDSSSATQDDSAQTSGGSPDPASATSDPEAASSLLTCPEDQVRLSPQHRGSFDPHARFMGLLAVIMPLLTTIVAFFFGQRAGAGEGKAESAALAARVMALDPSETTELTTLQQRLKDRGRL